MNLFFPETGAIAGNGDFCPSTAVRKEVNMIYLIDPKGVLTDSVRCRPFCGIKPLYGVPPVYCQSY